MRQIAHAPMLAVALGLAFLISSDRSVIADFSFASAVMWLIYDE